MPAIFAFETSQTSTPHTSKSTKTGAVLRMNAANRDSSCQSLMSSPGTPGYGDIWKCFLVTNKFYAFRIALYFIGMLYSFIGVFIVADIFMCSIDSISSTTRKVTVSGPNGEQEVIEVPVWNGTIANIVLMSLGPRSAPEILLSIVGIVFNGYKQDELGPSLIVGSGAFNLLVISAIRCQK